MKKHFIYRKHTKEAYLLVMPALIILAFVFFAPAVFNIFLSFYDVSLFNYKMNSDSFLGFGNFIELFHDNILAISLKNTTLWLTLTTVVLRILLGLSIALLLNAKVLKVLRLSGLFRTLALLPWMTPPVVAVAVWNWLLEARYGAYNQILMDIGILQEGIPFFARISTVWIGIISTVVWRELPFVIITLLAGLQSIPDEIYSAAKIDGASSFQTLFRITIPLLKPVIGVVVLLTTIWTFNNFLYVWLLTRGGPGNSTQVLATQMYEEAFVNYRIGYGSSVGVLMSVIMLIFALIYFKTIFQKGEE